MDPLPSFLDALPPVLGQASPSLAAFHAARARSLFPQKDALPLARCARCGHSLLDGNSRTRIVREKHKAKRPNSPTQRRIQQSSVSREALPAASPATPPTSIPLASPHPAVLVTTPRTDGVDQTRPLDAPASLPSGAHSSQRSSPSSSVSAHAQSQDLSKPKKSRHKQKSGLQEMLARNRERQQHDAANRGPSGLATFLHGL
ncbi:hypothetical protein BC834DRAFT_868634 [Gloeopeniophorella convolvens]|nr:hypothetical protein BC834DRAFT_868634 [Gloeopeniophorella convolvens]